MPYFIDAFQPGENLPDQYRSNGCTNHQPTNARQLCIQRCNKRFIFCNIKEYIKAIDERDYELSAHGGPLKLAVSLVLESNTHGSDETL